MGRQKRDIKKVEDIGARKVTFSKRKGGLFKKARELSTLCDTEVALIVFSETGKLYQYSSSSMMQILQKHKQCKQVKLTLEPRIESRNNAALSKEITEKNLQFRRRLEGEELQGLGMEDLMKLEKLIKAGLSRIVKIKEARLKEENARQKVVRTAASGTTHMFLQSEAKDSTCNRGILYDQQPDINGPDTFLTLGADEEASEEKKEDKSSEFIETNIAENEDNMEESSPADDIELESREMKSLPEDNGI